MAPPAQTSLKLVGYEVFVEIQWGNGRWKKAEVYKPSVEHDNKIIGYIESRDGAAFRISWKDHNIIRPDVACDFFVDGMFVQGFVADASKPNSGACTCTGKRESATTRRQLQFTKLQVTDDDTRATTDENVVKNAGSIQVSVLRTQIVGSIFDYAVERYADKPKASLMLPEHGKLAQISHTSTFGKAIKITSNEAFGVDSDDVDSDARPYCSFRLEYLSRDLLEARGIVYRAHEEVEAAPTSIRPPKIAVKQKRHAEIEESRKSADTDDTKEESEVDKLRKEVAALREAIMAGFAQAKVSVQAEEKGVKPDLKRKGKMPVEVNDTKSYTSKSDTGPSAPRQKKIKVEPIDLTSD